jgi:hypothetical protein
VNQTVSHSTFDLILIRGVGIEGPAAVDARARLTADKGLRVAA